MLFLSLILGLVIGGIIYRKSVRLAADAVHANCARPVQNARPAQSFNAEQRTGTDQEAKAYIDGKPVDCYVQE